MDPSGRSTVEDVSLAGGVLFFYVCHLTSVLEQQPAWWRLSLSAASCVHGMQLSYYYVQPSALELSVPPVALATLGILYILCMGGVPPPPPEPLREATECDAEFV